MLLLVVLCLAALAPGAATVWLLRHHRRGWLIAALGGVLVTASVPFLLLVSLVLFPPLGILISGGAALAAVNAYDHDRIWVATAWAVLAAGALACAGWSM